MVERVIKGITEMKNYTIVAFFLLLVLRSLFASEDIMWDFSKETRKQEKKKSFLVGKELILHTIKIYQFLLSEQQPDVCNFTPSCSHYAYQVIKKQGSLKGTLMAIDRLQRCNPWAWNYVNEYYEVKWVKGRGYKLHDPP